MKKTIHVNQNVIRSNTKNGTDEPPIIVRTYKEIKYAKELSINDSEGNTVAKIIYRPHKPLSCGARLWLETDLEVVTK